MTPSPMDRALQLARQAQGTSSPNPPVGAVLVHGEKVVGEGHTQQAGKAHAEIVALERAGAAAAGATLYVTLEPCSHWGRTPPCTDALIAAGVQEVHIATLDPNPRVNGAGLHRLEQHGIRVTTGEGAPEAVELVEAHARFITTGLPFLTLLLDASPTLTAQLLTVTDAVLTDRPLPLSAAGSGPAVRPPLTVVVGHGERIADAAERIMVATTYLEALRHGQAVESQNVLAVPSAGDTIDYAALLAELGRHEITSCLAMGSADLSNTLLAEGLVDKIVTAVPRTFPAGFAVWRERTEPSLHAVLYPAGRVP